MKIVARPIDPQVFAPFGQVLESPGEGNRLDQAAQVANLREQTKINVCVVRASPASFPLTVTDLERHPFSSQTFFPLRAGRYLVMVAPGMDADTPDISQLQAFIVHGHQGVNYMAGTWHHPLATIGAAGEFGVLMWEDGGPRDTDWWKVPEVVTLTLE